jgi:type 1 glutamine amidotransferase
MTFMKRCAAHLGFLLMAGLVSPSVAAEKKLLMLAGSPSHGYLEHEYRAGCLLLQKCLANTPGLTVTVVSNNWPVDESIFKEVDAVFMFCTGGDAHPAIKPERLKLLSELMRKKVGFGTCHYGVEVPKGEPGDAFLAWQGGYFEMFWSVNPHWTANFTNFPSHPVARGVKPFKINDEWYYHMRFPEGMKGVTPILTAMPPDKTRGQPGINDPHGGNPEVQKYMGQPEHMMWVYERPDGGRGFGFTGAHFHKNWADDNFRKVMLNALLWIAKIEVPANGIESSVSPSQVMENLDPKSKR